MLLVRHLEWTRLTVLHGNRSGGSALGSLFYRGLHRSSVPGTTQSSAGQAEAGHFSVVAAHIWMSSPGDGMTHSTSQTLDTSAGPVQTAVLTR